jgi:hypothetical protein
LVGLAETDYFPFFGGHLYIDLTQPWLMRSVYLGGVPWLPSTGFVDVSYDLTLIHPYEFFIQALIVDPGAIHGLALTNALQMNTQ